MYVIDLLASRFVAVRHYSESFIGNTGVSCDFSDGVKNSADLLAVFVSDVIESGDMVSGNDENMGRGSGVDVLEGQTVLIAVNDVSRDLFVPDSAKKTISHDLHLLSPQLSRPSGRDQGGLRALGLALLLLVFFSACASITGTNEKDFHAVAKKFNHDLRWKYNEAAAARVAPKFSVDFFDKLDELEKDLNITAVKVRQVKIDSEAKTAELQVHLRYYLMPSNVLKTEKVKQFWKQINGRWTLFSMEGGPVPFPEKDESQEEENPEDKPKDKSGEKEEGQEKKPDDKDQKSTPSQPVLQDLPSETAEEAR